MLEAEIRGKLPEVVNSEDCLTSTVFCLLKYSPMNKALWDFIGSACQFGDDQRYFREVFPAASIGAAAFEVRFWEHHGDFGIPDLLLVGRDFALVIEVKYGAGLSGENQLRKYHALLDEKFKNKSHRQVIYLTADLAMPRLTSTQTQGIETGLWWLSWYQLSEILISGVGASPVAQEMAKDLVRFLRHRGLELYRGVTIPLAHIPNPIFWDGTSPLISQYDIQPSGQKLFWKEALR